MKLVVIPGLNGNDQFCIEFLEQLSIDTQFIPLPEGCPQDHKTIANKIAPQLPQEPFILLVESFAGSIAPYLAANSEIPLKGIIFFVSLLAPPNKLLLDVPKLLTAKSVFKLPLAEKQLAARYLNNDASPEQVKHVRKVIEDIPHPVLQQRAQALKQLDAFPGQPDIPVAYVEASNDKVLNQRAKDSIAQLYPGARKYPMEGSHFLLYTKPHESAALVEKIYRTLIGQEQA
ncbi:alpha/beta hydrolase family protein [Kangiella shandongensis]|uniref:hypothetical protein n=1 Tax=Kangiella shandongensis TaxID=2763258 RepID=UPI001CBA76B3|nr:hypothetical protein [Kangiella shandongensis]